MRRCIVDGVGLDNRRTASHGLAVISVARARVAVVGALLATAPTLAGSASAAPASSLAPAAAAPADGAEAAPTEASPPTASPTEGAPAEAPPSEAAPGPDHVATSSAWPAPLTVRACPFAPPTLPAQTEVALDATLLVETAEGFGSAVLVSPDGFALTAAHVVGRSDEVRLVGHGEHELRGTVVRVDEAQDVALLKVEAAGDSPCLPPVEGRAPIGSDVFVLGSPAGKELAFSVAKGIVSAYRKLGASRLVQLDAALNPGNSGGPAVSADGRIIGIASWKVSHVSMEGLAFAVPIDVALYALGVTLGAVSSPDWASLKGRSGAAVPAPAVEHERPSRGRSTATIDPALLRRRRVKTGLLVWGSSLLASGVVGIGVTVGIYYARDEMTVAGWNVLQGINAVGWGMAIGGSGLLLGGLVLRKTPKSARTAMHLVPNGRGLALHGRF